MSEIGHNKKEKGRARLIRPLIFVMLVVAILILNHRYGWSAAFGKDDWYGSIRDMVATNFAKAALIYIAVMVVACVVLAVPGVTFAIIAGAIFGPWIGTLLCALAATIGAIAAFLVGRFFLRDSLRDKVARNKYISRLLFDSATKDELTVLMVTRLVPIFPYNLQNFAYGITDISLLKYSLGTFVFLIPGTAMYTFGISAITGGDNRWLYLVLAAAIAAAVTLAGRKMRQKYVSERDESRHHIS